jgi:4-amino-4-deoxychorismate lyase
MCRLLETIKLQDGKLMNLHLHEERMNRSRLSLMGYKDRISFTDLQIPSDLSKGIFKCRIIYSERIETIEFVEYKVKPVNTLRLVYDDSIQYEHKFLDRSCFEKHLKDCRADDILIVKNGLLTDVSFSNIILFDGYKWLTPALPILEGTKRKLLLEQGQISPADIRPADLKYFQKARLINAMLDLEESNDIDIINILL